MPVAFETPIIAFVWRPEELHPAVVRAAENAASQAIFDCTGIDLPAVRPLLQALGDQGHAAWMKISWADFMDPSLEEFLQATGVGGLWVEFHSLLSAGNPHSFLDRVAELTEICQVFPILSEVALILELLETYPGMKTLVLKGCEASGLVSSETIFTLYATVRDRLRQQPQAPQLFIWGGVATPEAAAAFLATGARGIVCESLHWLTDLVAAEESVRRRVAQLRPDHTDLVGLNLGVPCRLFNRGNSLAVKELRDWTGAPEAGEITREPRRALARRVQEAAVPPLKSRFSREELIPLGVEAAFAQALVARFGASTEAALSGFVAETLELCTRAARQPNPFLDSPLAREMGTRYPFIQGAMSWITDVPEFARVVSEAGGLPTIALGLMDRDTLEQKLGRLPEILEGRPYAVNIIALPENPCRDVQVQWLQAQRPRFAVIAAGEPSYARNLQAAGLEVIYIAADEELLRLALEAGIKYVILEGNEAGGHVGRHTTLTLAQTALDLKRREPDLFKERRIILAGGIYNRETAFMAAMLGADGIQMGTAYLATREIVATGALSENYQRLVVASAPGMTMVSGEGTGLRVRSLRTPRVEAISALERELLRDQADEASLRQKIEELAAGSLFLAARGLDRPGGAPVDEATCREQGQFMSGACAGAIRQVKTVAQLHQELAAGLPGPLQAVRELQAEAAPRRPSAPPAVRRPRGAQNGWERVAVTGMSQVNALGNSPEEVWAACLAKKSGIGLVPPSKWDHRAFYDPHPRTPEKTYCRVGAFQQIEISRKALGIPPQDFRTMTSATRLTMWLAEKAIQQSGILASDIPRERIAVLISQNSGEAAATLSDLVLQGSRGQVLAAIKKVVQLSPELEQAIIEELKAGRLVIDDTTLLGRLNCTAGGFISNKYGFMGPSYAVSAACATSLVALYSAMQMIRSGVIDAAVVGGGEENLTPMHFLEFSALGALAGLLGRECPPEESSRPFDLTRDGMVLGEGGGMIVIERESVARRRGAQVYACITGMGASNNHLGLVESSRETQEIAIRASFQELPYGPEEVDLVECHATATMQGDVEEVWALKTFFPEDKPTALTSFKSQIGHTLGASGLNSLIRGVMAMQAGVLPPTLNYRHPDPEMGLDGSGLWVPTEPCPWQIDNGRPRRLQVNSFGFGGSNYVMQLEQSLEGDDRVLVAAPRTEATMEPPRSGAVLPPGVWFCRTRLGGQAYRAAVVAASESEAQSRILGIDPAARSEPLTAKTLRSLARQGVHLGWEGASPPPLALVFPGQGAQYAGMGYELYQTFPVIRQWMDRAAAVADFDLLKLIFHDREEDLQKTRWQQPATFTLEYAMVQYLWSLGLRPVAMAGHSLGELVALATAGVFSMEDGFHLVNKRAQCMDKACTLLPDPGIMVATDAPLSLVEEMVQGRDHIFFTNYNAPNQVVLGGDTKALSALREEIKGKGYRATILKVSMAFHSPRMQVIREEMQAFVDTVPFHPPQIPVISNTTREPFPADPAQIKKIVMAHLESPVRWMDNVHSLWNDFGVRTFLEVGPGDTLSNLIAETLQEPECLQTCLPEAESQVFKTAVAQLLARGYMPPPGAPQMVVFPEERQAPQPLPPAPASMATPGHLPGGSLERLIQRELNAFTLETFGRFLRPALLNAIRREHDPNFGDADLDRLLQSLYPGVGVPAPLEIIAAAAPLAAPRPERQPEALPEAPAAAPPPSPAPESRDVLDTVIRIIMEATGYERDEIEPDMDLRVDLAIRSSRLPVIIDNAEKQFGIEIRLEEFMTVRTVRDLAEKIAQVIADQGGGGQEAPGAEEVSSPQGGPQAEPVPAEKVLKRLLFSPVALERATPVPLELKEGERVAVFTPGAASDLGVRLQGILAQHYGAAVWPGTYLEDTPETNSGAFDLRRDSEARRAATRLEELGSLTGLVLVLDDTAERRLTGMEEVAALLNGCFGLLKALAAAPERKFVLLLNALEGDGGLGQVLAQGLLGMFLSAALEYPAVQFRVMTLDNTTGLEAALREALDRGSPVVETIHRQGELCTCGAQMAPIPFRNAPVLELAPGDVVVCSGGGYGITPHLARSLAPFGVRVALLGSTGIDLDPGIIKLLAEEPADKALRWAVMNLNPEISQADLGREISRIHKARQVLGTLESLRAAGLEVSYHTCDVTDSQQVKAALGEIIQRYGKIDGVIHGAGILRDAWLTQMTPEDFAAVLQVKLLGAWNLFQAAENAGLRFLVALSSVAAIQGNPGQVNYAGANRAMSQLLHYLRARHPSVSFKALMLPPIAGMGMAADPEIRKILEKKQVGYIQPDELAGVFLRELLLAPPEDVWVMYMRELPEIKNVLLDSSSPTPGPGTFPVGAVSFPREDFALLDSVSRLDLHEGVVTAVRSFSRERDLWIPDHKPFKFLRHPLISTIMALEACMEAARLLYPYLVVRGVREARFWEMIECPPDLARPVEVTGRRTDARTGLVVGDFAMTSPDISPAGRILERTSLNYRAQIILSAPQAPFGEEFPGFPVALAELDTRPMDHQEVIKWYEDRTDMQGRYRVMEDLDGTAPGAIRGRTIYRAGQDFASPTQANFQYSPYLLEALMQLVTFYVVMRDQSEERSMIPIKIGEVSFSRKCRQEELITLEARLQQEDQDGLTWNARALDGQGNCLMQIRDLLMQWFSG